MSTYSPMAVSESTSSSRPRVGGAVVRKAKLQDAVNIFDLVNSLSGDLFEQHHDGARERGDPPHRPSEPRLCGGTDVVEFAPCMSPAECQRWHLVSGDSDQAAKPGMSRRPGAALESLSDDKPNARSWDLR